MANLIITMIDQFTPKVNSMANANKGLSKSMEEIERKSKEYNKMLKDLNKSLGSQQTQLRELRKEVKAAEKAFDECTDSSNRDALDKANEKYANLKSSISDTANAAKKAQAELRKLNDESSKTGEAAKKTTSNGLLSNGVELLQGLAKSGVFSVLGNSVGDIFGTLTGSSFGTTQANYTNSIVGGLATGAAMGTAAMPGIGTAIGAFVGALSGWFSAKAQEIKSKDEAFKSAAQENYDSAVAWRDGLKEGGSDTAAQREKDMISFDTLLGGGGKDFIAALSEKAADTPMEYADLVTLSKTLATAFRHTPNDNTDVDIMSLVQAIGDAGGRFRKR